MSKDRMKRLIKDRMKRLIKELDDFNDAYGKYHDDFWAKRVHTEHDRLLHDIMKAGIKAIGMEKHTEVGVLAAGLSIDKCDKDSG